MTTNQRPPDLPPSTFASKRNGNNWAHLIWIIPLIGIGLVFSQTDSRQTASATATATAPSQTQVDPAQETAEAERIWKRNWPYGAFRYSLIGAGGGDAIDAWKQSEGVSTKYSLRHLHAVLADLVLYQQHCQKPREMTGELKAAINNDWQRLSEEERRDALDYESHGIDKEKSGEYAIGWAEFCKQMPNYLADATSGGAVQQVRWWKMSNQEKDAANKTFLQKEKDEREAEKKRQWDHDFNIMWNVKSNLVDQGWANSAEFGTWHHSLDVTIGSHNPMKADGVAEAVCQRAKLGLYDKTWKVRVYFADGTLASECAITG